MEKPLKAAQTGHMSWVRQGFRESITRVSPTVLFRLMENSYSMSACKCKLGEERGQQRNNGTCQGFHPLGELTLPLQPLPEANQSSSSLYVCGAFKLLPLPWNLQRTSLWVPMWASPEECVGLHQPVVSLRWLVFTIRNHENSSSQTGKLGGGARRHRLSQDMPPDPYSPHLCRTWPIHVSSPPSSLSLAASLYS